MAQESAATDKKSFVLYKDMKPIIDKLTVPQCGHLLKAIYQFQCCGEDYDLDPVTEIAMINIISHFKRDAEKYSQICAKRRKSGSKGGKQKVANASKCKQNVAKLADSDSVSDIDSENEIDNTTTPSAIASAEELFNQSKKDPVRTDKDVARRDEFSYTEDFTAFWTAYPKKVGKGNAFEQWKRIKGRPSVEVLIQAVKKQQRSEDWTKERGKFIPHPSTWLHQRRWEDEVDVRKSERPYGYQ